MRALIAEVIISVAQKIKNTWKKIFMYPYWKKKFKRFGENVSIGKSCDFIYDHIEIGDDVQIGDYASFIASVATIHIGNHVLFGPNVTIRGGSSSRCNWTLHKEH